jgi:creatinine amidohydrolase
MGVGVAFMTVQGYWADLKAPEFHALPSDIVVVLPIGATEQHGPHLPVSVDADLVDAVVTRTLATLTPEQNVLVLPTLTVTKSGEHDKHRGTLSLSADTLMAVLRDVGASVARAGVTRLMMLNGHGGNTAVLEIIARDLRIEHDLVVAHASWFAFADNEGVIDAESLEHDIHAGDSETSPMLAIKPDLVDMSRAEKFTPKMAQWAVDFPSIGLSGQSARPGWIIDDISASGACGNATAATAEKGETLLSSAGENFATFLNEFAKFDHRESGND